MDATHWVFRRSGKQCWTCGAKTVSEKKLTSRTLFGVLIVSQLESKIVSGCVFQCCLISWFPQMGFICFNYPRLLKPVIFLFYLAFCMELILIDRLYLFQRINVLEFLVISNIFYSWETQCIPTIMSVTFLDCIKRHL